MSAERPTVSVVRDYLSCIALAMSMVLMLAVLVLGFRAYSAGHEFFEQWERTPAAEQLDTYTPEPLPSTECIGELPCD